METCGNSSIGLHHLSGGKSPTASTLALVLHRAHHSFFSPVDRGGQVPSRDCGTRGISGQDSRVGSLYSTQVEASELLLGEIRKLCHSRAVAGLCPGQLQLLQIGGEDLEPGLLLIGAGVGLVELRLELFELLHWLKAVSKDEEKENKKKPHSASESGH